MECENISKEQTALPPSLCPFVTTSRSTAEEVQLGQAAEVKAFKLGRKRHSYNKIDLCLCNKRTGQLLGLREAKADLDARLHHPDSSVAYNLLMANLAKADLQIYVVYDNAQEVATLHEPARLQDGRSVQHYEWFCVERGACSRSPDRCCGPVLVPMKRFNTRKSPSSLHLSIDEASNHVGVRCFRLLFGVFAEDHRRLIGTACSRPIRVLVNNDAPGGAPSLAVRIDCEEDWSGWGSDAQPPPAPHLLSVSDEGECARRKDPKSSPIKPGTPLADVGQPRCASPAEALHTEQSPCHAEDGPESASVGRVVTSPRPGAAHGKCSCQCADAGDGGIAQEDQATSRDDMEAGASSDDEADAEGDGHLNAGMAPKPDGPATPDQAELGPGSSRESIPQLLGHAFGDCLNHADPQQLLGAHGQSHLQACSPEDRDGLFVQLTRAAQGPQKQKHDMGPAGAPDEGSAARVGSDPACNSQHFAHAFQEPAASVGEPGRLPAPPVGWPIPISFPPHRSVGEPWLGLMPDAVERPDKRAKLSGCLMGVATI